MWTRSRDGLGGVLRKVLVQRDAGGADDARSHTGLGHPAVQHMLLVDVPDAGRLRQWLDPHPPLGERIRRIYGRSMGPLALHAGRTPRPLP